MFYNTDDEDKSFGPAVPKLIAVFDSNFDDYNLMPLVTSYLNCSSSLSLSPTETYIIQFTLINSHTNMNLGS